MKDYECQFTLNSPLTQEDWDKLKDVEMEKTTSVTFHTKGGKEVEFIKVVKCKDCISWAGGRCVPFDITTNADEFCSKAYPYKEGNKRIILEKARTKIEPVRCKDCKYVEHALNGKGEHGYCCGNSDSPVDEDWWLTADWYCAEGERKGK